MNIATWQCEPKSPTSAHFSCYNVRKACFSYLLTTDANAIEELPSIAASWWYSQESFPCFPEVVDVLHSMFSIQTPTLVHVHKLLYEILQLAILMLQALWAPEHDPPHQGVANYSPPATTAEELRAWQTHRRRLLRALPLKVSWEKLSVIFQKRWVSCYFHKIYLHGSRDTSKSSSGPTHLYLGSLADYPSLN